MKGGLVVDIFYCWGILALSPRVMVRGLQGCTKQISSFSDEKVTLCLHYSVYHYINTGTKWAIQQIHDSFLCGVDLRELTSRHAPSGEDHHQCKSTTTAHTSPSVGTWSKDVCTWEKGMADFVHMCMYMYTTRWDLTGTLGYLCLMCHY